MPPRKPNPAAAKRPANARYSGYTRADGTRVKGHTRSVKTQRMIAASTSAGTAGVVAFFTIAEFGFGAITAIAVVLTALVTWLAVIAGDWAAENKKKQQAQRRRTTTTRKRTGTRTGTRRR